MTLDRQALLDDTSLVGRAWCSAYTQHVDDWLAHVFGRAAGSPAARGVSLVAVGGYGRGDVSPHSDVDLLVLVDDKRRPSPEDLRGLLYPLWDAGFQVGHAVCTPKEAIERARGDLEAATSKVIELGGSWDGSERTLEQFVWRTCQDPDGNEFDIALVAQ